MNTQGANLIPAEFNFDINSPGFLGGNNFHNLVAILLLVLLVMRK